MQRQVQFIPNEYYHVYNRGVDKRKIFFSDGDWKYFQRLLYIRNDAEGHIRPERVKNLTLQEIQIDRPLVHIQAYCLMPNHFHLLLSEIEEGGISTYMRRLLTSYSMYMNKKYNRTGPLMCRPFRAKHINSDAYMRWVISYIHLNPIEKVAPDWEQGGAIVNTGMEQCVKEYRYSSYLDYYVSERDETSILNKQSLPFFINDLESVQNLLSKYQENPIP